MNKFTKFLSLLCVAGVAMVLAACGKKTEAPVQPTTKAPVTTTQAPATTTQAVLQDINVLGSWAEIEDDGVYTIATNSTQELHFTYAKKEGKEWAGLQKEITVPAGYKSLQVEVAEAGSFKLALVLNDNTKLEIDLPSTTIKSVYDWNLRDADLTKVTAIQIFAAPGKFAGAGELHFTKLEFSTEIAGENGEFIVNTGDNLIKSDAVEYEGGDTVNCAQANKMFENDPNTYTFEQVETAVKVTKNETPHEWCFFKEDLVAIPQTFTLLSVTVKGTAGTKVLVKPDDNVGGDNWYVIQADNTSETFYVKVNPGCTKLLWFISQKAECELLIEKAELSARTIAKTDEAAVIGFADSGNEAYTISENENGVATIQYDMPADSWHSFNFLLANRSDQGLGKDISLIVTVKGAAGTKLLFKLNDKLETYYTIQADNTEEEVVISGDKLPKYFTKSYVFVNYASAASQGTLTMSMKLAEVKAPQSTVEYDGETNYVAANGYWKDAGSGSYTLEKNNDGSVKVTVNKKSQYDYMVEEFTGFGQASIAMLLVELKGTKDYSITFKPNDNGAYETKVTIAATDVPQVAFIPVPRDLTKVIVFADIENATSQAEFTIVNAYLVGQMSGRIGEFVDGNGDNPVYTIDNTTGLITYTNKGEWANFNNVNLTVKEGSSVFAMYMGKAGSQVLVKFNDDNSYQNFLNANGSAQYTILTAVPTNITKVHCFFEAGQTAESGTGMLMLYTFDSIGTIDTTVYDGKAATLNINQYWQHGDAFSVTEAEGKATIVKSVNDQWASIRAKVQGVTDEFKYAYLVISGKAGTKFISKPNDTNEQWITIPASGKYEGFFEIPENLTAYILMFPDELAQGESNTFVIEALMLIPDGDMVAQGNKVTKFEESREDTVLKSTAEDGTMTFEYNQAAGYKYIQAYCYGKTVGLKLKVTVTSATATKLLVKLNDSNQYETWITLTDGTGTAEITGDKLAEMMDRVLLFFDAGQTSQGTATVKLEWVSAE